MSNKLGQLTIGIASDVNQLRKDMAESRRIVKRGTDGIAKSAAAARRSLTGLVAGLVSGVAVRKIILATKEQEQAVKQLEQGLASTGGVVGQSIDELKRKAAELQKVTTFGDEDIIRAQSQLVTFTKITGDEFDRTIELSADLSARFGTDLKSSVIQFGKALNDPVANLSALSRSGIQFSKTQKDMIKQLVESGRLIDAQKIILKELETQFGGSAKAARDTFGGALEGLTNSFGDLFEAKSGLDGAKESVESMTTLLQDPKTIEGINNIVSGVVAATSKFIELTAVSTNWIRGLSEDLARFNNGPASVEDAISSLESLQVLGANLAGSQEIQVSTDTKSKFIESLIGFSGVEELKAYLERVSGVLYQTTFAIGDGINDENDKAFLELWTRVRDMLARAVEEKSKLAKPVEVVATSSDIVGSIVLPPAVDKEQEKQLKQLKSALKSVEPPLKKYLDDVAIAESFLQAGKLEQHEFNNVLAIYKERLDSATGANDQWKKDLQDAGRFAEQAKTDVERLADELARAKELSGKGLINDETLGRTTERINADIEAIKEGAKEIDEIGQALADGMQDVVSDGFVSIWKGGFDEVFDSFGNLLLDMAAEAITADFLHGIGLGGKDSKGGNFSGLLDGLLSFDGGGFTGSGPRTGGLDGRGGFLSVIHPNETVLDHTRGQSVGAGGNTTNNIYFTAGPDKRENSRAIGQIKRELASGVSTAARYT